VACVVLIFSCLRRTHTRTKIHMRKHFTKVALAAVCLLAGGHCLAQVWVPMNVPFQPPAGGWWRGLTSSADGSKLAATPTGGPIYLSSDGGATWLASTAPSNSWFGVASSADGKTLVAITGNFGGGNPTSTIYISTNAGLTWSPPNMPDVALCISVACSTNATVMAAVGCGALYLSTNSGTSWNLAQTPSLICGESVALSGDGSRIAVATSEGLLYTSPDGGNSWTSGDSIVSQWMSVASSADGMKLVAVSQNGLIYTSTNAGTNWSGRVVSSGAGWFAVASSTDGTQLVAAPSAGPICISSDSGATWKETISLWGSHYAVTSSADGGKLAVVDQGKICSLQPSIPLSYNVSSNNLVLSWMYFDNGFNLQQSSGLNSANWTNVTNAPTFTDDYMLHVAVPMSAGNLFFRLQAPTPLQ